MLERPVDMGIYVGKENGSELAEVANCVADEQRIREIIFSEFMPKPGDLKWLARKNPIYVDIGSAEFNGWVYADGQSYAKSDFPSAAAVFGDRFQTGPADTFSVPDMRTFVRPMPCNAEIKDEDSHACVPLHYHVVDAKLEHRTDAVLSAAFTIGQSTHTKHSCIGGTGKKQTPVITKATVYADYVNMAEKYKGYVPIFHGAGEEIDVDDHQVCTDLIIPTNIKFSKIPCRSEGDEHPDAYPAHVLLQVMVYIGRKGT